MLPDLGAKLNRGSRLTEVASLLGLTSSLCLFSPSEVEMMVTHAHTTVWLSPPNVARIK